MTAPPIISSMDNNLEGTWIATTNEIMKSEIEAPPKIMPLSFEESGKKPGCPVKTAARTSIRYIASKIIAIEDITSDMVFLTRFIV